MPATIKEIIICSAFIFLGAFLEAYLMGGITAEQIKKDDEGHKIILQIDYVCYSMEVHNFPV